MLCGLLFAICVYMCGVCNVVTTGIVCSACNVVTTGIVSS